MLANTEEDLQFLDGPMRFRKKESFRRSPLCGPCATLVNCMDSEQ